MASSKPYRTALGLAIATAVLLLWFAAGVGIIGADGDPANRMYLGVLGVGLVGALIARLRPHGMALALLAMALVQALIGGYAIAAGLGAPYSPPLELLLLNGFFVAGFAGSAWLFRRAAGLPSA
jgi:hypothetical protein